MGDFLTHIPHVLPMSGSLLSYITLSYGYHKLGRHRLAHFHGQSSESFIIPWKQFIFMDNMLVLSNYLLYQSPGAQLFTQLKINIPLLYSLYSTSCPTLCFTSFLPLVLDLQNIICNTCSIFLFNYEHNIHLLNTTYMCFISYCVFCLSLTIRSSLSFQSACNCSCCPSHAFDWKLRVCIALENMIREIQAYVIMLHCILFSWEVHILHFEFKGLGAIRAKIGPNSDVDKIFSKMYSQYVLFRNKYS